MLLKAKLTKGHPEKYNKMNNYVPEETGSMTKALISVTGLDTTGIIARVATKLSEMNINIVKDKEILNIYSFKAGIHEVGQTISLYE